MTQEEKQILLLDLCARLPYSIICNHYNRNEIIANISDKGFYQPMSRDGWHSIEEIKPYLRPMSSMTEEEKNDFCEKFECAEVNPYDFGYNEGGTLEDYISTIPFILVAQVLDWLNFHYFDYRGLIEKGLALEAPENMYNK